MCDCAGMNADQLRRIETELPSPELNVMVQCEGFRCLAYRTRDGNWVSAFSGVELNDVIRVLTQEEEPDSCVIPIDEKPRKPRRIRVPIRFQDEVAG